MPYKQIETLVPKAYNIFYFIGTILFSLFLIVISEFINKKQSTLTKKQKKQLMERSEFLQTYVKAKKKQFYEEYLEQSIVDFEQPRK